MKLPRCTYSFLACLAIFLICCNNQQIRSTGRLDNLPSENVAFRGTVRDQRDNMLYGAIQCFNDTEMLDGAGSNLQNGSFSFRLPRTLASRVSHLQISSSGFDTLSYPLDKRLLNDSVVELDFLMTARSVQYIVVIGSSPHRKNTTYDTTWLDRAGKAVTRAHSDSVWQVSR